MSDPQHLTCVSMRLFLDLFYKQKTAYEMRISDWSSDVCSSDLMQIGEILIAAGAVTAEDVQEALRRQRSAGGLLGDNLVALGLITAPRLESILKEMPQPPRSLAETGIAEAELLNLLLKPMYARSLDTTSQIGRAHV